MKNKKAEIYPLFLLIVETKMPQWNNYSIAILNVIANDYAIRNVSYLLFPFLYSSNFKCKFAYLKVRFAR